MKIYFATDHAGFELKEKVKKFLSEQSYDVVDCGAFIFDKNDDYPDFISQAAKEVSKDPENARGIVFGKSGAGEGIVANKYRGVRAFLGINKRNVELARQHNDANVLSLGSAFISDDKACELAKLFLETQFSNEERYKRRIEKIKIIEKQNR